jgi:hypothetical protein
LVVIGGDKPQAGRPAARRPSLGRLDQSGAGAPPLLGGVQRQDLALPAGLVRYVREHAQQAPIVVRGHECRVIERIDDLTQAGHPGAVIAGEERPHGRSVGAFARSHFHPGSLTAGDLPGRPPMNVMIGGLAADAA